MLQIIELGGKFNNVIRYKFKLDVYEGRRKYIYDRK